MIGRMVRDPELRTTNTGKSVLEFSLAVDKRIKPSDSNQPSADFFRMKCWGNTAEYVSNYGGKGRLVAVDGRLETRKYVDKDGNNRELVEVVVDNVHFLDRAREEAASIPPAAAPPTAVHQAPARELVGAGAGRGRSRAKPAVSTSDEFDPFADE